MTKHIELRRFNQGTALTARVLALPPGHFLFSNNRSADRWRPSRSRRRHELGRRIRRAGPLNDLQAHDARPHRAPRSSRCSRKGSPNAGR